MAVCFDERILATRSFKLQIGRAYSSPFEVEQRLDSPLVPQHVGKVRVTVYDDALDEFVEGERRCQFIDAPSGVSRQFGADAGQLIQPFK